MTNSNCSRFWLGLGIGSVIGAIVYRYSCSTKGKEMKAKACETFHKMYNKAGDMVYSAKETAYAAGSRMADKATDATYNVAEKADDFKTKMNNAAAEAKK